MSSITERIPHPMHIDRLKNLKSCVPDESYNARQSSPRIRRRRLLIIWYVGDYSTANDIMKAWMCAILARLTHY